MREKLHPLSRKLLKHLPLLPGVYLFYDSHKIPLYVGKASNLKMRLTSYFSQALLPKTRALMNSSAYLSYVITASAIEALILESSLIKKHQSKYNIASKDDKSPLYLVITADKYPRVLLTRKHNLTKNFKISFGPFMASWEIKKLLGKVRKIFPFSIHLASSRPCLGSQMGLCHPCPSAIESSSRGSKTILRKQYLKNINRLKHTFEGKTKTVIHELKREMKRYAAQGKFEEANEVKRQLLSFTNLLTMSNKPQDFLDNPNLIHDLRSEETKALQKLLKPFFSFNQLKHIECFDAAHLSGVYATASSVTFINGIETKALYRRYRLRNPKGKSDTDSLKEVIGRRLKHIKDWGVPDLIIVDGGRGQIIAGWDAWKKCHIPLIGLTKREETLIIPLEKNDQVSYSEIRLKEGATKNLVVRLRNEAHRFAQKYHHDLITKALL